MPIYQSEGKTIAVVLAVAIVEVNESVDTSLLHLLLHCESTFRFEFIILCITLVTLLLPHISLQHLPNL